MDELLNKFSKVNVDNTNVYRVECEVFESIFDIKIAEFKYLNDLFYQYNSKHKELAMFGDTLLTKIIVEIGFKLNKDRYSFWQLTHLDTPFIPTQTHTLQIF